MSAPGGNDIHLEALKIDAIQKDPVSGGWRMRDNQKVNLKRVSPEGPCFFMYDLAVCKMRMETEAAARCDPRQV